MKKTKRRKKFMIIRHMAGIFFLGFLIRKVKDRALDRYFVGLDSITMRQPTGLSNKSAIVFVCSFLLLFNACDPPPDIETEHPDIMFVPNFIIQNKSLSAKSVVLKQAQINHEREVWNIYDSSVDYQPRPLSCTIAPGETEEMVIKAYRMEFPGTLSFILNIDGRNFAGFTDEFPIDTSEDISEFAEIDEYGLGYVLFNPKEIQGWFVFISTLTPLLEETGHSYSEAFYHVTITDDGVEFVLEKLKK
jgi:hypothetical protein